MKTYTLEITEADNGWIVKHRVGGGMYSVTEGTTYVVPESEDLAQYIKAGIVSGKLLSDQDLARREMEEKMRYQTIPALQNAKIYNPQGQFVGVSMNEAATSSNTNDSGALTKLINKVFP